MASTPTTITCCNTSDRFSPLRNRSDWVEKNRQVTARASQGPRAPQGILRFCVVDITVSVGKFGGKTFEMPKNRFFVMASAARQSMSVWIAASLRASQ